MKKIKRIMLVAIVASTIFIKCSYAETAEVKIEATRVREQKDVSSKIITVIYEDDKVEVLEEKGDWCKIKYEDNTGYVKKEFLKFDKKEETTEDNNETEKKEENEVKEDKKDSSEENKKEDEIKVEEPVKETKTEESHQELAEGEVCVIADSELKIMPSFISRTIEKIEVGKKYKKVDELNHWVKITDGTQEGWILKNKVSDKLPEINKPEENEPITPDTTNEITNEVNNISENTVSTESQNTSTEKVNRENKKTGKVNVETAKIREGASTQSKNIGFLDYNDVVEILAEEGDWYKIKCENETGFVNKKLITLDKTTSRSLAEERKEKKEEKVEVSKPKESKKEETNKLPSETNTSNANTNSAVSEFAKKYLGYAYVLGGKTPDTGFDCSGFTRYVYKNFGYNLASVAAEQNSVGDEVAKEDLKPGDLILFQNEEKTKIGHTGIYIGNNEFIHAANPQRGVVIDNIVTNSYYKERFVTARRIVK